MRIQFREKIFHRSLGYKERNPEKENKHFLNYLLNDKLLKLEILL